MSSVATNFEIEEGQEPIQLGNETDYEISEEERLKLPVSLQKITRKLNSIQTQLINRKKEDAELYCQFKVLKKLVENHMEKQIRTSVKEGEKKTRKPSGFASPSAVTDELCVFMDKPKGSLISRTEAIKFISKYIADNKLKHPDNKSIVVPDEKLANLLGNTMDEKLTFFTMQKFITRHFTTFKNKTA